MVATAEYIAVVYVSAESISAKAATTIVVTIEATVVTTFELGYFIIQLWVGSIWRRNSGWMSEAAIVEAATVAITDVTTESKATMESEMQ